MLYVLFFGGLIGSINMFLEFPLIGTGGNLLKF